jgi:predicted nucleotidyltransferase
MPTELVLQPHVLEGLAEVRRWPSEEARQWVEQFVHDAADDPRIHAIVAYGSAVRDVPESSDVDLLYVYSGEDAASATPPMDVELREFQAETLDDRVAAGDEVLGWSLRYGVPLFEREGWWTRLQSRWADRLPLPSATAAEERAARALKVAKGLEAGGDEDAAAELRLSALTQQARARLIRHGVFPLSRPELPEQLASIGEWEIASELDARLDVAKGWRHQVSGSPAKHRESC